MIEFRGRCKSKKKRIYSMLENNGEMNTSEILQDYNSRYKRGCTMNELASILGRTKHFIQVGFIEEYVRGDGVRLPARVRLAVWSVQHD